MKKYLLFAFVFLTMFGSATAEPYFTHAIRKNIRTMKVSKSDVTASEYPLLSLNSDEVLTFSFDCLNSDVENLSYTLVHCNADWTQSSLSSMEYMEGFSTGDIETYATSFNTNVSYTHYEVSFPNENVQLKLSGNYALLIHPADDELSPIAVFCFYVTEQTAFVSGSVSPRTMREINGKYQQLSFDVMLGNNRTENPLTEIRIDVEQNRRKDNRRERLTPSFVSSDKLSFSNHEKLIFEGGSEYQTVDFSSRYAYGEGIDNIRYHEPFYHVNLMPDSVRTYLPYVYKKDRNGRYVINVQEWDDDEVTADYFLTHFTVKTPTPFFDGKLYVIGDFNQNELTDEVKMQYSTKKEAYEAVVLMKQGGYNYQYVFVPKGKTEGTTVRVGGSHWETENEYTIYVYHRPFGARYDKLIAVYTLQSNR